MFDFYADYYVNLGMGRFISKEEALSVLDIADKAGLVCQPSAHENPELICNCCRDYCTSLMVLKTHPAPGTVVHTNYFAKVDANLCVGCGDCVERCPMNAIVLSGTDVAEINLDRCIGCGLCVSSCPAEALRLMRKPDDKIDAPPQKSNFMKASADFEAQVKTRS